jgi:hypothetical protein
MRNRPCANFRVGDTALGAAQFATCDGRRVLPLFLWCERAVARLARRDINHALRPLAQIARAGMSRSLLKFAERTLLFKSYAASAI